MLLSNVTRGLSGVHTLFPSNSVIAKEPYAIFEKWFTDANKICDARVMYLSTCSESNLISCKPMICTSHSKQGFKFFTTHKVDEDTIPEGSHVAASFMWPLKRAVRLEGITFHLPRREAFDFFNKLTCEEKKRIVTSKSSCVIQRKSAYKREVNSLMENLNGPLQMPNFLVGHCIMPQAMEFYQSRYGTFQERLRFCKSNTVQNDQFLYEGVDGWAYEILSP